MSQWQFHSSSKKSKLQRNPSNMSGCNASNNAAAFSPFHRRHSDPFQSQPKIARTPMVFDENRNPNLRINNNKMIGKSPALKSFFIPNTPGRYNEYKPQPQSQQPRGISTIEEIPIEPGSAGIINNKRQRKRRRSSTCSQPEGTFSPIPRSKFLSELNESFSNKTPVSQQLYAQSPISMQSTPHSHNRMDEKEQSPNLNQSHLVSSELKRKMRSEVLAELEQMEHQITKEMNDEYLLLNPSPSSLLSQMSKLNIRQEEKPLQKDSSPINNKNDIYNHSNSVQLNKDNKYNDNNPIRWNWKQILLQCFCNKDICLGLLNFVWIMFIFILYWNVVDFQWT